MENHYLSLENREKLTLNQVVDVDAFDENNLWANIKEGAVEISGENLSVEKLDLDEGLLVVKGKIKTFTYIDEKLHAKSRLARLLKK
ncbi:MAG: sporulation protein YabP [Firmicutes bacterium]|nr:sporulation protein YabP [Bacillota bacterium]